jgi:hypothetical protein
MSSERDLIVAVVVDSDGDRDRGGSSDNENGGNDGNSEVSGRNSTNGEDKGNRW